MAVRRRSISTQLLYRNQRGNVTPKFRNAGCNPRVEIRGRRSGNDEARMTKDEGMTEQEEGLNAHAHNRVGRQTEKVGLGRAYALSRLIRGSFDTEDGRAEGQDRSHA